MLASGLLQYLHSVLKDRRLESYLLLIQVVQVLQVLYFMFLCFFFSCLCRSICIQLYTCQIFQLFFAFTSAILTVLGSLGHIISIWTCLGMFLATAMLCQCLFAVLQVCVCNFAAARCICYVQCFSIKCCKPNGASTFTYVTVHGAEPSWYISPHPKAPLQERERELFA